MCTYNVFFFTNYITNVAKLFIRMDNCVYVLSMYNAIML